MKGSRKMEIIAAIICALITATFTVIVMGILGGNAVEREADRVRKECEADLEEEQEKCNRYRETLDGFIERHNSLKEKLTERDKEISKLKYQLKAAENVINAIDNELSGNTSYSKERLPKGHTNMFMGMPHWKITDKSSDQYALQQECVTGDWSGIRMYDTGEGSCYYYCVALGTAYGTDIGDTWRVTLRNGSEFNVILAEYKHDITDPDPNDFGDPCHNYDEQDCTNVLEFIYDEDIIPDCVLQAGTFTELDFFGGKYGDGGDIVKMEYTGRKWER